MSNENQKLKFKNYLDFLESCKINKNDKDKLPLTHTIMGDKNLNVYPGSYHIDQKKKDFFYDIYTKWVFGWEQDAHLTEKHHPDYSPVIIDLDFRYNDSEEGLLKRKYTVDDIIFFLDKYFNLLEKYLSIPEDSKKAYVMEKSGPSYDDKKKIHKDGVHIIIPKIVSKYEVLYLVRYEILKDKEIIDLFKNLGFTNPIEDIVDRAVIKDNNWFMYGSSKPGKEYYKITSIIKHDSEKGKLINKGNQSKLSNLQLVKLFSVYDFNIDYICNINDMKDVETKLEKFEGKKKTYKENNKNIIKNKSMEDITIIRKLTSILSEKRADAHDTWIRVGWCLHNIDYDLLEDWIKFSAKSEKSNINSIEHGRSASRCENLWNLMANGTLGVGSLYKWAREDNKAEYDKIMRGDLTNLIKASLNLSHYDIAKVVYKMFGHEFKCVSNKNKEWFQFKNHRWVMIDNAVELKKKISEDVVNAYCDFSADCNSQVLSSQDEDQRENLIKRAQVASKISLRLKDEGFRNNVMSSCSLLFHDQKFYQKLDENVNLIGFENGVYDLENYEFREGLPEDYISFSTGINYSTYEENESVIKDVHTFLSQVLPIPRVKEYVLKVLGSFLSGKTGEEKFHIWTGCHAYDSKIMMSDGNIKKVQDITKGEFLMGPDSKPRKILNLVRGNSDMYQITPSKGEKFEVNGDHIMMLKATNIGSSVNSDKENRVKLSWQEKDENGYPINKCKNFPYENESKKIYIKNVKYYKNKEEAFEASIKYKETLNDNENVIKDGDIIEIPLKEYLKRMKNIGSRNYYLYKVPIDFEEKDIKIDPYILGYWLGDGNSNNIGITSMEKEVIDYFDTKILSDENMEKKEYPKKNSEASTIIYSSVMKTKGKNKILNNFKEYNLIDNKHIPQDFKINDRTTRLNLLAGLMDSDGYYNKSSNQYEICLKSEKLIDDILYLVRSLGYAGTKKEVSKKCHNNGKVGTYYQIIFYGHNLTDIPVKLIRKQARERVINKDPLRYGFKVKKIEESDYYGFRLNGDHQYVAEDFIVHHNCGGNGKSKLIELFELAFGDYCGKMSVTLVTQKRAASNACTPELIKNKGKRLVTLQEPDEDEKIHVGAMKELTGGDKIQARGLHKDPIEFKPQWKIVLTSNVLPEVTANDEGTWRRIRVTEFISKFREASKIKPEHKFHFPIDYDLSYKLKLWCEAFMYILINEYKNYKKYGLVEPEEVIKNTKTYQEESDSFMQFANECITTSDLTSKIKFNETWDLYQMWFKNSGLNIKQPTKKDFKKNISQIFQTTTNGSGSNEHWKGLSFVNADNDESDYDSQEED